MRKHLFLILIVFLTACGQDRVDRLIFPKDQQTLIRGRELVTGLAACGVCHGVTSDPFSPLAGGRTNRDTYGELLSPNITPSMTGIGDWSDEKVLGSLRGRWGEDAKKRSPDVHKGYEWMSDKDAMSVVSYLRTLAPMKNEVAKRPVGFMDRNTTGFFESQSAVAGYVPEITRKNKIQYGKYLVDHVARCGICHSTPGTLLTSEIYLGGSEVVNDKGTKFAPQLSGGKGTMSYWSEPEIVNYFKGGQRPDGSYVDSDYCPVHFYSAASLDDLAAIATYIRSLS